MYIVPPGPLQGVSVYGSLCTGTCSQGLDNFYYCEVPPQVLILMIKTVSGMIKQANIPNKPELLNHIDLQVSDGTTEPCGPEPGSTHANQPCSNDCR